MTRLAAPRAPPSAPPGAPPRRPSQEARPVAAPHRRAQYRGVRRRRRVAGLVVLAIVALVTLLLTAFGARKPSTVQRQIGPAPANRLLPSGPPSPQVVALDAALRIQLPI